MGEYRIREMQQADIESVVDLWRRGNLLGPWDSPLRDLEVAARQGNSVIFVVEHEGGLIATATVTHDGQHGWAYYVAISPALRNHGFGKLIMDHIELWLKERGIRSLHVIVRQDNERGLSFYEHLGYSDLGVSCLQKDLR